MRVLCVLFLLCLPAMVKGQSDAAVKAAAKAAAEQMGQALVSKDYAGFVRSTHPNTVKRRDGGLLQLEENIRRTVEGTEASGNKILKVWPEEPSAIIDTAGELQCTIPQNMTMQLHNGKITTTSTLIGMSPDEGKTWYFADMAGRSLAVMRKNLPNISSRHIIAPNKQAQFEPNKSK